MAHGQGAPYLYLAHLATKHEICEKIGVFFHFFFFFPTLSQSLFGGSQVPYSQKISDERLLNGFLRKKIKNDEPHSGMKIRR